MTDIDVTHGADLFVRRPRSSFHALMNVLDIDEQGYEEDLFHEAVADAGGPEEAQWITIKRGGP